MATTAHRALPCQCASVQPWACHGALQDQMQTLQCALQVWWGLHCGLRQGWAGGLWGVRFCRCVEISRGGGSSILQVWCTHLEQWPVAAGKATGRSPRVGRSDRRSVSTWFPTTNWVSGSIRESHGDKESRKTSVKSFGGVSRGLHGDKSFGNHNGTFTGDKSSVYHDGTFEGDKGSGIATGYSRG